MLKNNEVASLANSYKKEKVNDLNKVTFSKSRESKQIEG